MYSMKTKPEWKCLELLGMALGNNCESIEYSPEEYSDSFREVQQQAVAAIPGPSLSGMKGIPEGVLLQWKKTVIQQVFQYEQYSQIQKRITDQMNTEGIPFVILKGTSASCYYPRPELRAMGDIDIMTRRNDIDRACVALERLGYVRFEGEFEFGRTIKYFRNGMEVEIHKYFTSLNDPDKAEYLDNLILSSIKPGSERLPDNVNGLVLLEHIGDHLEHGLGLRQIIDWMMYVRNCLGDPEWETWFKIQAETIGLDKLAMTVTKMCQIYLGLDGKIKWCSKADNRTCWELMNYIMTSGNFGAKASADVQRRETVEALTIHRNPIQILRLLQQYGKSNWKMTEKHPLLKPFAWIYQIGHSIRIRIRNKTSAGEVYRQFKEGKARKELFERLGVKQYSKGLAVLCGDHFEVEKTK